MMLGRGCALLSGGPAGGAFTPIVDRGASRAAEDTRANVSIIHSARDLDRMITQLRDITGQAPDGIALTDHPGDTAILPLTGQVQAG